jgi:hypothetical protein
MDAAGGGSIDRDDFVLAVQPGMNLPYRHAPPSKNVGAAKARKNVTATLKSSPAVWIRGPGLELRRDRCGVARARLCSG